MAFNFLSLSDGNVYEALPFAFADQLLYSTAYGVKVLYLSAYGYAKNVDRLKPVTDGTNYEGRYNYVKVTDHLGLNIRFENRLVTKNCYESKVSRLPGEDAVRIVNYPKRDYVEINLNRFHSKYHLVYVPLPTIIDYLQANTAWDEARLVTELFTPTAQFKNNIIDCEAISEEIYKAVRANVQIPFLKEWVNYIMNHCPNGLAMELPKALYADVFARDNTYALVIKIDEAAIKEAITEGLRNGGISINGCNVASDVSKKAQTLTEYLQHFSNQLIDKAASKFTACFNPETDEYTDKEQNYFDYVEYFGKLRLYEAQKNVICAVSRSLNHNRSSFIIGECGAGKTALGIGSIYCHSKTSHINSVILCPGHLTRKWSREILRLYPDARTRIIADFHDLMEVEQELTCALRRYPLFLILSKDTAKIDYTERPSAIYDAKNQQFLCPNCGSPIYVRKHGAHYDSRKGVREQAGLSTVWYSMDNAITLFLEKNDKNSRCITNRMTKHYNYTGKHNANVGTCGSSLWTATNTDEESKWVRHPSVGWLNLDMIPQFMDWFESLPADSSFRGSKTFKKIYTAIIDIQENGVPRLVAPRRYSLARFIREKFSGHIDYLVADECHLYNSGESAQSNAFGDLVKVANKTIALTGTLLNGYSDNIYHLLMRMYSREFVKRGYTYDSASRFVDQYGVSRDTIVEENNNGRNVRRKSTRTCPGVSPKLFTEFLLDKACFISLSDMSNALPSFTETCVPVDMDSATQIGYDTVIAQLRSLFSARSSADTHQIAFTAAQKLNLYPDMPYDTAPIYSHNTGEPILTFPNVVQRTEDFVSNKDIKVLEITKERIERGEKVLIYTSFVNKVDVVDRMLRMFEAADIKACNLTASVKPSEREAWIDRHVKEGYQVMITNPTLVETGLDLLHHTSIIYVSLGYNLFTLRQSSRRSLRLNQVNPVHVYYLFYRNTTQQTLISLMSEKLRAAMAIEGKFSEEGLQAMNNNDSMLTQIANSLVDNIERKIDEGSFSAGVGKAEEEFDSTRFVLAQMLNDKEETISYSFLPKVKRPQKLNLQRICA